MIVCTRCGQQADPGETFCPRCGAFLEWTGAPAAPQETPPPVTPVAAPPRRAGPAPSGDGPALVATASAGSVSVEAGGEATVGLDVINRGRTVDQVTLEIPEPAASWTAVEPPRLNLMPDTSGHAVVRFRPPRTPALPAGTYRVPIAALSHEHPEVASENVVDVEVRPFSRLEARLAPSVLRGTAKVGTRLQAWNGGNTPVDLSFVGEDPEGAFVIRIDPPGLRVEPGATGEALVVVAPRAPIVSGPDRPRPFRVIVTASDGSGRSLDGTFVQAALPPPPDPSLSGPPLLAALGTNTVQVEPGGQAAVAVEVVNRTKVADRVTLDVRGPAAAWATPEPARFMLAPSAAAGAGIVFRPPRVPTMRPGRYPADVVIASGERPQSPVVERVDVEVLPYSALDVALAPSVLRGIREGKTRVRISNGGNRPVDLVVSADDPEAAFGFRVSPSRFHLAPATDGIATVAVRAHADNRTTADVTRSVRVLVTAGDGARQAREGTFVQVARHRRRGCLRWLVLPVVLLVAAALGVVAATGGRLWDLGTLVWPPNREPTVRIVEPPVDQERGAILSQSGYWVAGVYLRAEADDPEDGSLPPDAFTWRTNRTDVNPGGLLGQGREAATELRAYPCGPGFVHEVTVTVRDSAGREASASRRITLNSQCP